MLPISMNFTLINPSTSPTIFNSSTVSSDDISLQSCILIEPAMDTARSFSLLKLTFTVSDTEECSTVDVTDTLKITIHLEEGSAADVEF